MGVRGSVACAVLAVVGLWLDTTCMGEPAHARTDGELAVARDQAEPLPFRVIYDAEAPVHRIMIPSATLAELTGNTGESSGAVSGSSLRSIVAAIALSASLALGLLWFRRNHASKVALVLAALVAMAGAGGLLVDGLALADMPPPQVFPRPPRLVGPRATLPAAAGSLGGQVRLEVGGNDEEAVVLAIGQSGLPHPAPRTAALFHSQPRLATATDWYEPLIVSPLARDVFRGLGDPFPAAGIRLEKDVSLEQLRQWLQDTLRVPVRVDNRALEDAGFDIDSRIAVETAWPGTLGGWLHQELDQHDLSPSIAHETLIITTKEEAEENLLAFIYPVPLSESTTTPNVQALIDLIQGIIAPDTWDVVGGPGAIRLVGETGQMVIRQHPEVHREIVRMMQGIDAFGIPDASGQKTTNLQTLVHPVGDVAMAEEIAAKLVELCNASLGPKRDPDATVTLMGGRLMVTSASRPFHVCAAGMIRAIDGSEGSHEPHDGAVGGIEGNPFCWVAREVYGPGNPRWMVVRRWMLDDAPEELRGWYLAHGEAWARWLKNRQVAKALVRSVFDIVVPEQGAIVPAPRGR